MHKHSCSSSHKKGGILFGLFLVVAGILFLSFNFGWIDSALKPVLFSWPMIFIVVGVIRFFKRNYLASFFWLIPGVFFLIPRIVETYPGYIRGVDSDFACIYWPLLLILSGIGFILKVVLSKRRKRGKRSFHTIYTTGGASGRIEKTVIFGGTESIFLDPVFYGGEISVIFGGVVLDLRKTQLPEGETYLNVDAIFGGVELHIPDNWLVEAKFQTVAGGLQDKRLALSPDNSRKLILQGDLIFGGCEIR
ncbi:MAG: cell wall-active antibiotics response protein [Proteiniphilum sp.]|jgi:predicted membrane protein|nr:cell wall-active antibiotics response protein [Proteiniphilum sp.]